MEHVDALGRVSELRGTDDCRFGHDQTLTFATAVGEVHHRWSNRCSGIGFESNTHVQVSTCGVVQRVHTVKRFEFNVTQRGLLLCARPTLECRQ